MVRDLGLLIAERCLNIDVRCLVNGSAKFEVVKNYVVKVNTLAYAGLYWCPLVLVTGASGQSCKWYNISRGGRSNVCLNILFTQNYLHVLNTFYIFTQLIDVMSFLGLEGYHVFITGAAGGIGGQAVKEFLGV